MHSETQRVRLVLWVFIFFALTLGAGMYWFSTGKYEGQAAETINASKSEVMAGDSLGLVGYWTLDGNDIVWGDTTSEIKDVNPGTKHHGNSTNLAAGSAVPGRTGQGLLFNGSSDTISLGNVYNGVKTVAFWVKPNSTTQSFIDLNATATVDVSSGTVRGNNFATPTIYVDGVATSTFPDTNWHHVAVTTATGINASAVNLGKISSSYFGGLLDDVRFYSGELSATQAADLYRSTGVGEYINAGADDMLTNGLVGYWTFDGNDTVWSDTSTEIKDVSGQGNHGNAQGSLSTASVTRGKLGQGLSFNGSDSVDVGDIDETDGASYLTVSAWVKQSVGEEQQIISKWTSGYHAWYMGTKSDHGVWINMDDGITWGAGAYADWFRSGGEWEHFVFVFNGTLDASNRIKFYHNGSSITLTTSGTVPSTTYANPNPVLIGDNSWNGVIDDVRIYNRALTATEVLNLYNQGK